MTLEFLKWLANRWSVRSEHGNRHWERLSNAITQPLAPDQTLIWAAALVELMTERWAALAPPGLATARTAVAFLQIEGSERAGRWPAPTMDVPSVERYLRVAFDEIRVYEEKTAQTRALEVHPLDEPQRVAFVMACRDELSGVFVALVIRAFERAIVPPAAGGGIV